MQAATAARTVLLLGCGWDALHTFLRVCVLQEGEGLVNGCSVWEGNVCSCSCELSDCPFSGKF